MAARRQQLATILILSAIDVLLCSFTASLTLFFIGAGADAANSLQAEQSAVQGDGESRGAGAPAAIIIATYATSSVRLTPVTRSGYSTMPATDWESADAVSWLIDEAPTERFPFVLSTDTHLKGLYVRLSLSGTASPEFLVRCPPGGIVQVLVGETHVRTDNSSCDLHSL